MAELKEQKVASRYRLSLPTAQGRGCPSGKQVETQPHKRKVPRIKACLSICGAIDLQAVTTGLSIEVLLCEAVEGFLYRETAIRMVHVVVDDQVVKLLRLAQWRRQRQQQHFAQPKFKRRGAAVHARIAGVHQRERDRA
jgi:hypothetical protein